MAKKGSKTKKPAKAAKTKRVVQGKHPKQTEIPGTEVKVPPDVQARADAFIELWDERAKLRKPEAEARTSLIETMREHEIGVFKMLDGDGNEITITAGEKKTIAVRRKSKVVESEDA